VSAELAGRRFHFVGIGGAGMSGLALAAAELGAEVSGSDRSESTYLERLRAAGITVTIGQQAENVPADAEVVRSTAIEQDNPELAAAFERGHTVRHRSELLAELAALRKTCITVAGSHGKTTTTAMIAHVLDELGQDPSYFVGGELTIGQRTTNAHMGGGEVVVIEADESDGSFIRYSPDVAVVTNIEFEHPETWSGLDQLIAAFAEHLAPARSVVIEAEQPRQAELALGSRAISFSITDNSADYFAAGLATADEPSEGTGFTLKELPVKLGVRGDHNVKNALAAIAALELVGVTRDQSVTALASFRGVARRFEHVGRSEGGAEVYDDYAHHPTEIRAALETARAAARAGRVVAFFQPHLYSRSLAYRREFAEALALADVVVVLEIYPARERAEDFPGVTGWMTATSVADHAEGRPVYFAANFDEAERLARRILQSGDLCIALGAGDIIEFSRRIALSR
jgi:UDP-N-acetylmuramate--alanine ligase